MFACFTNVYVYICIYMSVCICIYTHIKISSTLSISMKLSQLVSSLTCNSTFALHSVSLCVVLHGILKLDVRLWNLIHLTGQHVRDEDIYKLGSWNTHLATFSEFQPGLDTNRRATTVSFLMWDATDCCCVQQMLVQVHRSTRRVIQTKSLWEWYM